LANQTFSTAGLSVALVMPIHRDMNWLTAKSVVDTVTLFHSTKIPLTIIWQAGNSIIEAARSRATREFLKTDFTRLFWVDSDIAWEAADFLKLALYSTEMDVVCGAYCNKKDDGSFALSGFASNVSNERQCLEITGIGLGFACVNRKIMEELAAKAPRLKFPDVDEPVAHIFRCDSLGGEFRGEDMAFFSDVRALGYKVWLDPHVKLQHIGHKAYSASFIDCLVTEPVISPTQPTMPNP
jgi:hypothetical protein